MLIWERELIARDRRLYKLPIAFVVGPLSAATEFEQIHNLVRMASVIIELSIRFKVRCPNQTRHNMLLNPPPRDPGNLDFKFEIFYKQLISLCDIVLVMPGYERSSGCQKELAYARAMGKPIYLLDLNKLTRVHEMHSVLEKQWPIAADRLADLLDFGGDLRRDSEIEKEPRTRLGTTRLNCRLDWRNIVTALP